jgi:hypothetical protein
MQTWWSGVVAPPFLTSGLDGGNSNCKLRTQSNKTALLLHCAEQDIFVIRESEEGERETIFYGGKFNIFRLWRFPASAGSSFQYV